MSTQRGAANQFIYFSYSDKTHDYRAIHSMGKQTGQKTRGVLVLGASAVRVVGISLFVVGALGLGNIGIFGNLGLVGAIVTMSFGGLIVFTSTVTGYVIIVQMFKAYKTRTKPQYLHTLARKKLIKTEDDHSEKSVKKSRESDSSAEEKLSKEK